MSKEAMKLALEALETERENYQDWDKQDGAPEYIYEAITALRQALAEQPAQQQEPVARSKAYDMIDRFLRNNLNSDDDYAEYSTALDSLYTSPPASKPWVGLTRDERMSIINRLIGQDWVYALDAIEAKLKEKNA